MNNPKALTLLIFLAFSISCFSQKVLKGVVKDSLQNPLPYANIIAQPQDSLKKIQFSITDEQGRYMLDLKEIPYTVTVSYMGYRPFRFQLHPTEAIVRDIVLKEKAEELEEVIIEPPIIVKEDTIIYKVDKLVTGEERKLKDVLKKLPGVEVGRDGSVTVQGKKVTVMLVENKKFFGGGTKLAVDNIPADAIYKVEVLDNYNEVALLKGLQESNDMALNVKLKEDKKNFAFGDIEAGKGNQNFYNLHSNLFYYSSKTMLNFIGNINNTANEVFTYRQYFDFQSGLNQIFAKGKTIFDTPNDDFLQFIESNDVVKSDRKFGAVNISQEVNNKLNISGYAIFSNTKEETLNQSTNQYNTFTETKELSSVTKNIFAIGNINAVYLPNLTDQWHFKTKFKKTKNQFKNTISSSVDNTNNAFLTNKDADGSFFNQAVEWHRKKSRHHIFSAAVNYTFDESSPRTRLETPNAILEGLIPIMEARIYKLDQFKKIKNNQFESIFKHYWVINKNNHVYSTVGNTYLNQQFFTRDVQILDNGDINDFDKAGFENDLDFMLNDFFIGSHYKFKLGLFTFNQGAFLHHYYWNTEQENRVKKSKTVVLPSFSIEAKLDQSKEIKFDYNLESSFSEAVKFAEKKYIKSYNSIYQGNDKLENQLFHDFVLRYTKFSTYRGFSIYLAANYVKKAKDVIDAVEYHGINQSVTPILVDNPENKLSFYGRIRKRIKDVNFSLNFRQSTSKYLQQINNVFEENKNSSLLYDLKAKTLFDDFPIIEIGFKQNIGSYTLSGNKSEFITNEPYLNIEYDFLKGFIASFDYTSYKYKNKSLNQENNYELANTSLYYKKDSSAWSFKIEVQNLFNVKFKNRNYFSSYVISDTKTYILPRIIMFSVGYNL